MCRTRLMPLLPTPPCPLRDAIWEAIEDRRFQPGGEQTITASWDQEGFEAGPATPGTGGPRCHLEASAGGGARAWLDCGCCAAPLLLPCCCIRAAAASVE